MKKEDLFSIFKVDDIRLLPEAIMPVVISNSYERDDIYRELLELNNHDVSHDWFQYLYEGEFSERKDKYSELGMANKDEGMLGLCEALYQI